jgi:hypothetical protein
MAKKAYYIREANPALEAFIVKENDDKTVDLSLEENGKPFVTSCVVTKLLVNGSCTLTPPAPPSKAEDGVPLTDPDTEKGKPKTK